MRKASNAYPMYLKQIQVQNGTQNSLGPKYLEQLQYTPSIPIYKAYSFL